MQHYVTAGISTGRGGVPHLSNQSSSFSSDAALLLFQPFYKKNTFFYLIPQQDIIKDLFKQFALDLCFDLTLEPSDQCV